MHSHYWPHFDFINNLGLLKYKLNKSTMNKEKEVEGLTLGSKPVVRNETVFFLPAALRGISQQVKSVLLQACRCPYGSRRFRLPRFLNSRHMKVARLSALHTGRRYSPRDIPGTHFFQRLSLSRAIVRVEGQIQWKISMASSGIEAATFQLVAQSLNQLRHRVSIS